MQVFHTPSPNYESRQGRKVDMLVMHYTGMDTAEGALDKLRDPTPGGRVSSHYLVEEDGSVHQLVDEDQAAWHAGRSGWRGQADVNQRSIGIEIQNPGGRPFTAAQMQSVAELSKGLMARYGIEARNVVGHEDIAPGRKSDPGRFFPWEALAKQGIGVWPVSVKKVPEPGMFTDPLGWVMRLFGFGGQATLSFGDSGPEVLKMQKKLVEFGYPAPLCSTYGADTKAVVEAFQAHFRPEKIDGVWDPECNARLDGLLARARGATLA